MKLPYKIYSNKKYWLLRFKTQKTKSRFHNYVYKTKNILKDEKNKSSLTVKLLKQTLWNIIRAVAFVSLLFYIENVSTEFWQTHLTSFPDWLINLQRIMPKPTYPDDKDAVIQLLSLIASVTGVILALFYPVLATIASTAYAKVHASIRNLLFEEKESQNYLKQLTYLTACSITVLLFTSLHFQPGNLILSVLVFYCFMTLFGLLKIGMGVYKYFEPSVLAEIVLGKLQVIIKNVTTDGQYWNDSSFQNDNYKQASLETENLSLITSLSLKDDDLKESSFKSSIRASFVLLQYYLAYKPRIPIDSFWFPQTFNYSSYFESEMSVRDLSKNTNTYVYPKTKQNNFWFEERVMNNISQGIETIVKSGHVNVLGDIIAMSSFTLDSLSFAVDLKTTEIVFKKFSQNIIILNNKKKQEEDVISYDEWKEELNSIGIYCSAVLRFEIGFFERITQFNSEKISNEFAKINWNKKDTIYTADFIPDLFDGLNSYLRFIQNEKQIEGKQITPNWYLTQGITSTYLKIVTDKINQTIDFFETYLISIANHFSSGNNALLSSYSVHIGLEIIHKIQFRLENLKPVLIDLDKIEVLKGEFQWIKPDFDKIENKLKKHEQACLILISGNIEKLTLLKWNNQYPDVFAHSYSILSTHLDRSFLVNNPEQIKLFFPSFLKSAFTAFGNLNKIFNHYDNPQNISYQPLIDVMEISGYAYIYSCIYKNSSYWLDVKNAWDVSFEASKENIKILFVYYNYYKNSIHRIGINYNEKLRRERSLADVKDLLGLTPNSVEDVLVKPFLVDKYELNDEDAVELFIEIYLLTFVEAKEPLLLLKKREMFDNLIRQIEHS